MTYLPFFEHFERLVADKRYEEVRCDCKATQSTTKLKAELRILRHATKIYTPAVYKIFQEQVMQTVNCDIFCSGDIDGEKMYKIRVCGKRNEHEVKFSTSSSQVKCSCKKSLKILDINNTKKIPEEYILNRWAIDAKIVHIESNYKTYTDPIATLLQRRKELSRFFHKVATRAAESDETYFLAMSDAEKLEENVEKSLAKRYNPDVGSSSHPQGLHC